MNEPAVKTYADFALPPNVVSRIDVSHLVAEAERVDNEMTSAAVRAKTGATEQETIMMSRQLADFLALNGLALGGSNERSQLIKQMRLLKDNVPVMHMTFAVEADVESLGKLALWLRGSVHPQAVIDVGLQPALIAGVYLRTPNHVHDMSLRAIFDGHRGDLVKELEALSGAN